jgi:hypothetical protein
MTLEPTTERNQDRLIRGGASNARKSAGAEGSEFLVLVKDVGLKSELKHKVAYKRVCPH